MAPPPTSASDSVAAVLVQGAKIDVLSASGQRVYSGVSDAAGAFALPVLSDGQYGLTVTPQGAAAAIWKNGGIESFTVNSGRVQARGNLDVRLERR